jgi:hypothetical protein
VKYTGIFHQKQALTSQIYFGMKLYMFRTVPLPTLMMDRTLHVSDSSSAHPDDGQNSTGFGQFLYPP